MAIREVRIQNRGDCLCWFISFIQTTNLTIFNGNSVPILPKTVNTEQVKKILSEKQELRVHVQAVYTHPSFQPNGVTKQNNIAIIEVPRLASLFSLLHQKSDPIHKD